MGEEKKESYGLIVGILGGLAALAALISFLPKKAGNPKGETNPKQDIPDDEQDNRLERLERLKAEIDLKIEEASSRHRHEEEHGKKIQITSLPKETWKSESGLKKLALIVNVFIMVFTGVIVGVSSCQYKLSVKSAYLDLRPYVGINGIPSPLDSNYVPGKIGVKYFLKNFGKTPAYRLRGTAYLHSVRNNLPFPDPSLIPDDTSKTFYLAPGNDFPTWIDTTLANLNVNLTKNRIFLYGKFWYDDGFGTDHWTTFFYQYIAKKDSANPGKYVRSFFQYHQHNGADNNIE
jgi:hypothetical protein